MKTPISSSYVKSTSFSRVQFYMKPLLIVVIFLLLLTGLRLAWHFWHNPSTSPQVSNGILDLRSFQPIDERSIPLSGEWLFYPDLLLEPGMDNDSDVGKTKHVPGSWTDDGQSALGYGSYQLTLLVSESVRENKQQYGLILPEIPSAMKLYVNGKEVASRGSVATTQNDYEAFSRPLHLSLDAQQGRIELLLQVANYRNAIHGGLIYAPRLGTASVIERDVRYNYNTQIVVSIILFIHAICACMLYLLGLRRPILLHFSALVILSMMTILLSNDALAAEWLNLNYAWSLKWQYLCFFGAGASLLAFSTNLFPWKGFARIYQSYRLMCLLAVCFTLIYPLHDQIQPLLLLFIVTPYLLVAAMLLHRAAHRHEDLFLMLGGAAIASNVVWYYLDFNWLRGHIYYPLDLFAALLSLSIHWFRRYFGVNEEIKQLAARLQQTEKQKDLFLASTSHELRTPLHGMLNLAQQMEQRYGKHLTTSDHHNMSILIGLGRRMSYMLNDLLDHSRLPGLQSQIKMGPVMLSPTVDEVIGILHFAIANKTVSLHNQVSSDFPLLQADEQRLQQILLNLLHNAIKFTDKGEITVHARIEQAYAQISVSDSGRGIEPDRLSHIFQPYKQIKQDRSHEEGFGLGLSICMKLVRLHGGTLHAASWPGHGSMFTFTIPLLSTQPVISAADPKPVQSMKDLPLASQTATSRMHTPDRYRVLLVDNNPVNRYMIGSVLLHSSVYSATTTEQLMTCLEQEDLDLIIINSKLPERNAFDQVKRIRQMYSRSELPILLLHAEGSLNKFEPLSTIGINDSINPSADSTELKARIDGWCAYRRSVQDRLHLEAAFLQAQVQPEFLMGILNTASKLSQKNTQELRVLLEAFGKYLRYSFDMRNIDRLSGLMREKEAVEAYLDMMEVQYCSRVEIQWIDHTEMPVKRLQIPPLSLLPLIEFALPTERLYQQKLTVRLLLTEQLRLTIRVDEQLGLYPQYLATENVLHLLNHRLQQVYGSALQVHSRPDGGSYVWFEIVLPHESRKYDKI